MGPMELRVLDLSGDCIFHEQGFELLTVAHLKRKIAEARYVPESLLTLIGTRKMSNFGQISV